MRLIEVIPIDPDHVEFLYTLLAERPRANWISHEGMPSKEDHQAFVDANPFRYWYLIETQSGYVGALEVTDRNEIGIAILNAHQGRGLGREALAQFLATHQPLPPIKAVRNGHWLANVAADNHGSKLFFKAMGFKKIQETYAL